MNFEPEFGMLRGRDILILSLSDWNENPVSSMHISAVLSEFNTVTYVEKISRRMPKFSEIGDAWGRLRRMLNGHRGEPSAGLGPGNIHLFSPFAVPVHGNRAISWFNRKLLVDQIKRLVVDRKIKDPIVWSFSPLWETVIENLDHACWIFHCVDGLHTYDTSARFRSQYERTVCAADIVFTPGILLEEELKRLNPDTYRIGHGCAIEHLKFRDTGEPFLLIDDIPEPRIVYAGGLPGWFDFDLLTKAAKLLPEYSFVIIGDIHPLAPQRKAKSFVALPNVYLVGRQSFIDLPRFFHRSSVGIVPYRAEDEHIRYSTPTKFIDYLASGLPVVSTRFPAAEKFGSFVKLADSAEEFSVKLNQSIESDNDDERLRRRTFAGEYSWVRQVSRMSEVIENKLSEKKKG